MTTSVSRILLIADIGGEEVRHIGDEAMLGANLDALRSLFPGATFTVVAADPEWASRRYGVTAVPPFGFRRDPAASAERRSLLASLLESSERNATIDAVANADAVIVSGGGNLSSSWPDLLYERAALLQLAQRFGKPSVVLGQTIGPHLAEDERRLLAASLLHARFVGVRELPSAMLGVDLGIPHERLWYQFDDGLRVDEPVWAAPDETTIAVTIDPQLRAAGKALFASFADQLRRLAETTGARLVLVPHAFGGEASGQPSDLTEARLLAAKIGGSRVSVVGALDVEEARRAAAGASLIISSRYHPIVFGLIAGVPSLGVYGDDYCRIKLQGVLTHAGLERWTVTYDDIAAGALLEASLELWSVRDRIQKNLEGRAAAWRSECRERWAAVRSVLVGEVAPAPPATLFGRPVEEVMPAMASAFSAQRRWFERVLASREARRRTRLQTLRRAPVRTVVRQLAKLRVRLGWS